ncbi:uncharacterized protein LOC120534902 [Polypterus senegalus]|uniref:uncharacterized protein LOC120534902 n=1 Tax=Polypterus senegalus TaxID=55291 RepID=UPI001965E900|nr:uncharacterized protein LOC120534902 [Polypterus senegalus]
MNLTISICFCRRSWHHIWKQTLPATKFLGESLMMWDAHLMSRRNSRFCCEIKVNGRRYLKWQLSDQMPHPLDIGKAMQGCAWHCKTFNSAMFPKFPFDVRRSVARRRSVMFSILRSLSSEGKSILSPLPSQARVVICGGGIIGTSVAYHLAKLGWKDVVLLEQGRLGAGTTRLCAGIVSAVKQISIESKMASYSNNLYQQLEQETGIKTGYIRTGSICLAQNHDRFISLKRLVSRLRVIGIDAEVITPRQVAELHPLVNIHDLVGAVHVVATIEKIVGELGAAAEAPLRKVVEFLCRFGRESLVMLDLAVQVLLEIFWTSPRARPTTPPGGRHPSWGWPFRIMILRCLGNSSQPRCLVCILIGCYEHGTRLMQSNRHGAITLDSST